MSSDIVKQEKLKRQEQLETEILATLASIEGQTKTRKRRSKSKNKKGRIKNHDIFNAEPVEVGDFTTKSYKDYVAEAKTANYFAEKYGMKKVERAY